MEKKTETIEIKTIAKHGSSLALNIPSDMAKKMGLSSGCPIVLRFNENENRITIEKIQRVETHNGKTIDIKDIGSV